ncbi:MAG TPA: DNA recombination protein RmuC [Pseudonocardiaceae bacterium]
MEITIGLTALIIGLLLGGTAVWLRAAARHAAADSELTAVRREAAELALRVEQHRRTAESAAERAASAAAELAAAQAELRTQTEAAADRERLLTRRDAELREAFCALSADALARNNEAFVQLAEARIKQATATLTQKVDGDAQQQRQAIAALVDPVSQALKTLDGQLRATEKEREGAYAALRTQVAQMRDTSAQLQAETRHLVNALRAPQARGRWGEVQLERIVEQAGMVEHCDFDRQVTATGRAGDEDATIRPDLVVRLAGGKHVVVDAKVSLAAYLEAMDSDDPAVQHRRLAAHARHLRAHIDSLAGKSYWAAFDPTPEFVVLFVPGDSFLQAALAADPALLDHAFERNVVIATPTTLIALLRTVAYTWRQEALARNAAEVHAQGRELYERLSTMGEHMAKLGRQLGGTVEAYNKTVGALESRVLVTARRLRELKVTDVTLNAPEQVERTPRMLQAPEFDTVDQDALVSLLEPRELRAYGWTGARDRTGDGARDGSQDGTRKGARGGAPDRGIPRRSTVNE